MKVLEGYTIVFPDNLGNGSFRVMGNILEDPHIGTLFIDFNTGLRIRVNGIAEITHDPYLSGLFPDCIQSVKVSIHEINKRNLPAS